MLNLSVGAYSNACEIPMSTIYSYEKGSRKISTEYVQKLVEIFHVNPIWLFTGKGDMFIDETFQTLNYTLSDIQKKKISTAIKTALTYQNLDVLINSLDQFSVYTKIQQKFKNVTSEQNFWEKVLKGNRKKISFILILGKVLSSFQEMLSKFETITEENSKSILGELVSNYELKLYDDRLKHLLVDTNKDELNQWIQTNLSNFESYIILKNIPDILEVLKTEVNQLNTDFLEK